MFFETEDLKKNLLKHREGRLAESFSLLLFVLCP